MKLGERRNRGEYSDYAGDESEIVKCSDVERALAAKESDLTKTLYFSQSELTGLLTVASKFSDYLTCFPLSHRA